MAAKYSIKANIVDILSDTPKASDIFLVDSNVWFWMTYSKATSPTNQLITYPSYLKQALSIGAQIYYSGLTLAELAHIIEKTEREIFDKVNACTTLPKTYRHDLPAQRLNVVAELQNSWSQVKQLATQLSVTIDDATTDAALMLFQKQCVDGYDLFILESMKMNGITNVITDDADFATVLGIQVFTANKNVLNAAHKQNKIIKR